MSQWKHAPPSRQTVMNQAVLLSYLDVFWGAAIFAALMIPVALSLKTVNLSRGASAAD